MRMTAMNPAIPLDPPREWFTPPADMTRDTGCVVEPNGRIYGYLCHWNTVLMDGSHDRWTPPRSKTKYAYAHTGDTQCDDGSTIKTANLGGDAGHAKADPSDPARVQNLQSFYENTQTQLARVVYGEDSTGVWFAGSCWPTVTDLDIAKLRASARSGHWAAIGDWRDINSGRAGYELVGACLVNVPGLKYARADRAASGVMTINPFHTEHQTIADQVQALTETLGEYMSTLTTRDNTNVIPEQTERVAASGTIQLAAGDAESIPVSGVLVVEGQPTEDGRFIEPGAISWRDVPLPLYAKLENTEGHTDAQLVGRIDTITRSESDPNVIEYTGTIRPPAADGYGQKVLEAIDAGELKGVSIDGIGGPDDSFVDDQDVWHMTGLVIAGATLTPMPAINEASVTIGMSCDGGDVMPDDEVLDDDGTEVVVVDDGSDDQWVALTDAITSLADRLEFLIGLVESSQLNARLSAIKQREAAAS